MASIMKNGSSMTMNTTDKEKSSSDGKQKQFIFVGSASLMKQCRRIGLGNSIHVKHSENHVNGEEFDGIILDQSVSYSDEFYKNGLEITNDNEFIPHVLATDNGYDDLDDLKLGDIANAHLNVTNPGENIRDQIRQLIELREFTTDINNIHGKNNQNGAENIQKQVTKAIHSFLTQLETTHNRLFFHGRRTSLYSRLIAREMDWTKSMRNALHHATVLHDIGKVLIPRDILYKPDSLTDQEYEIVQTHTSRGSRFFKSHSNQQMKLIHDVSRHHHEHWDGSGYPDGLSGTEIPSAARILAVVDVFDAITNDRVYRDPMEFQEAVDVIVDGKGSHFDPSIVEIFTDLLPQIMKIESGEVSVVEAV